MVKTYFTVIKTDLTTRTQTIFHSRQTDLTVLKIDVTVLKTDFTVLKTVFTLIKNDLYICQKGFYRKKKIFNCNFFSDFLTLCNYCKQSVGGRESSERLQSYFVFLSNQ